MLSRTFNLATDRLTIRSFQAGDAPFYRQLIAGRNRDDVSPSAIDKWAKLGFEREFKVHTENDHVWLAGLDKNAPDRLALEIEISPSLTTYNMWDLRYETVPSYRQQGLMTEALAAVLPEMPALDIRRIFAVVRNENIASAKTLMRAGFKETTPNIRDVDNRHFLLTL